MTTMTDQTALALDRAMLPLPNTIDDDCPTGDCTDPAGQPIPCSHLIELGAAERLARAVIADHDSRCADRGPAVLCGSRAACRLAAEMLARR